jgi:hypothetical protein
MVTSPPAPWAAMPDLLIALSEFLPDEEVGRCMLVCREWYLALAAEDVWAPRCQGRVWALDGLPGKAQRPWLRMSSW